MAVVGDEVAVLQVEPGHDGHGGGEGGGAGGRVPPDEGGEPGELGGVVGPRQGEGNRELRERIFISGQRSAPADQWPTRAQSEEKGQEGSAEHL